MGKRCRNEKTNIGGFGGGMAGGVRLGCRQADSRLGDYRREISCVCVCVCVDMEAVFAMYWYQGV